MLSLYERFLAHTVAVSSLLSVLGPVNYSYLGGSRGEAGTQACHDILANNYPPGTQDVSIVHTLCVWDKTLPRTILNQNTEQNADMSTF